uniref:helix-turn-helix transcriptional regulator n=1 Tax=Tessaracoccus bendigoensis TaxID=72764 RepID=UPI001588041A|nr:helix-turn-helix domain-containing protein [Tessaracoccus bendigoensis]
MTSTPHGLGPTRTRVLAFLQAATEPRSVIDVAEELGLHKNSARFHLDALVESGFARREVGATGSQGRPPLVFTATSEAPTIGNLHLTELVQVLISSFVEPARDAFPLSEQAGRSWGSAVASQEEEPDPDLGGLAVHLGERGFGTTHEDGELSFTRCPFRTMVTPEQLPLVCAMHKGFLDGYLAQSGSDLVTDDLEVGPVVCRATFTEHVPAARTA